MGEPTHVRLFVVFLIVASCFAFVQSIRLFLRLYPMRGATVNRHSINTLTADLLARIAFTSRLSSSSMLPADNLHALAERDNREAPIVQAADIRFRFLWTAAEAKVKLMRRLVIVTLLVTLFIVVYGAVPTFDAFMANGQGLPYADEKLF